MAKTVILIDDDQDVLDILKESVKRIDSAILCISFIYPEEAIRVVSAELISIPNFIFIDINMPRITGDMVLKEFRKIKELNNSVITMLSTAMPGTVALALRASGANFTFQKPIKIEDYIKLLKTILED